MHYAFNRIRFNKQLSHLIGKENKKKYNNYNKVVSRSFSAESPNNKDPFPSWKIIAAFCGIGLYHQYLMIDDERNQR
jgi:hypothetical protein